MKFDQKVIKQIFKEQATRFALDVPPIPFEILDDTEADVDADDKFYARTFTLKLNPGEERPNTIEKHVRVFHDGTPWEWCKFRANLDDLEHEVPLQTYEQKYKTVDTLLLGKCRTQFRACVNTRVEKIDVDVHTPDEVEQMKWNALELALNDVAKNVFGMTNPVRRQKYFLRNHCFKTDNVTVREFTRALSEHNDMLKYFPYDETRGVRPRTLSDDELADILNRAKPIRWHLDMLGSNIDPYDFNFNDFKDYLERLEVRDNIERVSSKKRKAYTLNEDDDSSDESETDAKKRRKKSRNNKSKNDKSKRNGSKKTPCEHCGKYTHKSDACWELPKNASSRPAGWKSVKVASVTKEQVNAMIKDLAVMKSPPKKKRRVTYDSDSDSVVHNNNFMDASNLKDDKIYRYSPDKRSDCF